MRLKKKLVYFLALLLIGTWSPLSALADDSSALEIITVEDKVIFNLHNLKPGDTATRIATVQNRSESDFTYQSDARFTDGDEELYNEFLLEIADANQTLFSGKMKQFNGFSPRLLKSMKEEELKFSVEIPEALGNEFQGKSFEAEIRFFIDEYYNPEDPDDPGEPNDPVDPEGPGDPDDPGNPSDPEDPEGPVEPGDPEDSEAPGNPTNPEEPNGPEPQQSISPDDLESEPTDGQILPSTATNIYNYIVLGIIFMAAGLIMLRIIKSRKIKNAW